MNGERGIVYRADICQCDAGGRKQKTVSDRGPCGADDERLLDVGGFRGAGDEGAVAGLREAQALVGLMHVVDDLVRGDHQCQMLHDEINRAVAEVRVGDPNRAVFGDAELAG